MKIALILNSFPEISEKFLLNHVIGLIKAGVDITVFAAHRPLTEKRHDIFFEYRVAEYTEYLDIPRSIFERFLSAPLLFFKLFIKNPLCAIEAVRIYKYRTVAKNIKLLYFGNVFYGRHFDIIHCHFGPNGLIGTFLKECGLCSGLVTTFHGSDINSYPARHGMDVYTILYAKADLITSNTNFTKNKIIANGCPEGLIKIVPASLIANEYLTLKRTEIEPFSILTVGRLEEKKGHRYALEAIAILRNKFPEIRYYIAGDGSLMQALVDLATTLKIKDCCYFMGVCTNTQVKELYAKCAVFTLPSVTATNGDMEGQGLVIQEAQVCGLPVVTTWHNGIPDGLIENQTGFLVNEKDVNALTEKIELLLANKELCEQFGSAGKDFVSRKYDIEVITSQIVGYYHELLS